MDLTTQPPAYYTPGVPPLPQPHATAGDVVDSSLATEVLPAPPSLSSVQQAATKRDPKKPTPLISCLPQHDPGSTYTSYLSAPMHSGAEGSSQLESRRRKRVRVDKECVITP